MRQPIVRATTILFGSSTLSLIIWFGTTKIWTLLLGPAGLGLISLHQSLVVFATMLVGLGAGAAVVKLGAGNAVRLAALTRAAWQLFAALGLPAAAAIVALREPIARWWLGDPAGAPGVAWLALALLFSVGAGLQNGLLSAYHEVGALARMNLIATALGCAASIALIALGGPGAIAPAVVGIYGATWAVSAWLLHGRGGDRPVPSPEATRAARQELVRFGLPYTASMVVGLGVLQALPVLVLHTLGTAAVGFLRAATLLADNALGGVLNVMTQDYYPRIAAAGADAAAVINAQHRLVITLAMPLVFALYALAPWVIPLAFSQAFAPIQGLLEWLLIAALLKFAAWSLTYAVLARSHGATFFLLELVGGASQLVVSVAAMRAWGLVGLGLGALAAAIAGYGFAWAVLRRELGWRHARGGALLLLAGLAASGALQALPLVGLAALKPPLALTCALAAAAWALRDFRFFTARKASAGEP